MEKEIKFSVNMKVKYMYNFQMHHAYVGIQGLLGVLASIIAWVLYFNGYGKGDATKTLIIVFLGLLYTVINPVLLLYKAAKQVKLTPTFKDSLEYTLNKDGITVGQGEEEGTIPWDQVWKVYETKTSIILYFNRVVAYILPKECMGDQVDDVKQMIRENVQCKVLKLKK